MKNRISLFFVCVVLLCSTFACKHFTLDDANKMRKSMSQQEALDLASKGPHDTYTNASQNLEVQVYSLALGNMESEYFLAFKNNKLIYWGYPYEFLRHSDASIVEIAKWTVEQSSKN